ncbi:hypothetical protein LB553_21155 [Mesorhizobium sp. CA8]|uniref:ComEC/Rec2 family competence protein n=1 Tax=Mesorhizobium sp. CA8 TaxID=2876637 RepID=UPI001CCAC0C9|nr:MBL fold metallo-hydrolase [Mesorhizobium sp. CA8]MBZ9763371.1 hypothetical protein [Mesorhizobium sp. CA8]
MSDAVSISMLPAKDGDCLFVEAAGFRLLIDGGRPQTGLEVLPAFLATLPARPNKPTIDLMILTHVDADHIAGLLAFMAHLGSVTIAEVWFNGAEHHKRATDAFVRQLSPEDQAARRPQDTGTLSVDQALQFDEVVKCLGIPWNKRLNGEAIMVPPEGDLPRLNLTEGLDLVLLGPPKQKLADFYPEWEKCVRNLAADQVLAAEPRIVPTVENVRRLAAVPQIADRTKPNGASIVFVLEAGSKRVLFTADAHPDDVASAVERYHKEAPVSFDAVKVAHHGSAKNNTSELIDKLQSPCWLISTDGSGHGHPNSPAVARIVLAPSEGKRLVFNYRSEVNAAWDKDDLKKTFKYSTCYGDGKAAATVIV